MIDALQFLPVPPDDSLLYAGKYNPAWVVISVLLATLASYAALNASTRVEQMHDTQSKLIWSLISSFTLGAGIWAMHFIGMLALSLPCGIYYDPLVTLVSMIPGILAGGIALGVVWNHGKNRLSPLIGSVLLGAGIGTMHYTGMAALRLDGFVRYDPTLFTLSIVVAVALSYLALRVKIDVTCIKKHCDLLVALILGSAVSGMHYTAMSAAYFVRGDPAKLPSSAFTTNTLAILIAVTTVILALGALVLAAISRNREMTDKLRESEERWKFALEGSGDGVWDWNPQTDEAVYSRRWKEMLGYAEHEFPNTGNEWVNHLHADDKDRVLASIREYFAGTDPFFIVEFRMRCMDGSWKWMLARGMLVNRDAAGKPMRMIGTHTDISGRKRTEEALSLHASVFDNAWEGIVITDADANIIEVNEAFTEVTGYSREDVLGRNPRLLKSDHHDHDFFVSMWSGICDNGHWRGEIWNRKKSGELYAEILSISAVKNARGELTNYIGAFADITDLKNTQQHLENLANFDTLTHLPNRRLFHDRLEQELKKAHRNHHSFGLMLIDLDNFKEVNDTLGHEMGDVLLIEAALRIEDCVRESDTVARLGGDEFAIILPDLEDPSHDERIAQKIIGRLTAPFQLGNEQAYITASIGITFYPNDGTNSETLMKNADQAMYLSKSHGRNRFSYFTLALQDAAQNRMRLLGDLRSAVEMQQFCVHYQPIIDLANGHIRKAEALIRWNHPLRGLVSPAEFIPLAEDTGLIVEIGDWVYQQATKQVAHWRSIHDSEFQVSVNRSPVQFRFSATQQNHWTKDLQKYQLPGQSIVFEITEGLLLNAEQEIQNELLAFHDAGVQVAIDDFGTGYSSLAYLRKFDIDYLKIDQAFVRNLFIGSDDLVLVEAIIIMAHRLGLKVIAEGVETVQQNDMLIQAGCDYAQGFLYSKPVPVDEFEKLLCANNY